MKHSFLHRSLRGFTLIETLVSISVFAVGTLGIALLNGNALKVSGLNNSRATALNTSRQAMNDLFVAAAQNANSFEIALDAFDNTTGDSITHRQLLSTQNMTITILAATDSSTTPVNILTTTSAATTWVSPITMSVDVTYAGVGDSDSSNDKSARASYTFVVLGI